MDADVIVVGAGLAGLVAAAEIADSGRRVVLVDQEGEQNLGGQAFWSLGGLFMIDSPEQRRMGIKDSPELARQDWLGSAGFDRPEDHWPRAWADAYLHFAAGEKRAWLRGMGHRLFPVVGWAERGDGRADGHGNSVPRFHITWGTGPGVVAPFEKRVRAHAEAGRIRFAFRHQVDELVVEDGAAVGVRGTLLEPTDARRGAASSRVGVGEFELRAQAVLVSSGGIGGKHDLVRKAWPSRLGTPPARMVSGVPAHVDGRMLAITETAGARVINPDRMWHYVEGIQNWDPIWANHGIRILPGPSSLWLDATGNRLPAPYYPASTPSAPCGTCGTPDTTTRGSFSPRRSSRRSSRSPAPSRTPTSRAKTCGSSPPASSRALPARWRRSRSTATTSWWPTRWRRSWWA